ncbi:MAG: YdbL family protein [Gammaproteobacteria bacterium]|nr:YdbL family protein [Gammaproteobacteria bacterium]
MILALVSTAVFAANLDQAKRDGLVGERADGYLGLVVTSAPGDVVELVAEINKKRKAEYQRIAAANNLTLEQVQALAGKKAIEKTRAGDWILVNGGWRQK